MCGYEYNRGYNRSYNNNSSYGTKDHDVSDYITEFDEDDDDYEDDDDD